MLASLCSLAKETINHSSADFNQQQFITVHLLPEDQVQSQVKTVVQFMRENMPFQVISSLNFLMVTSRSNNLMTALNTNVMVAVVQSLVSGNYLAFPFPLQYSNSTADACNLRSPIIPSGFYSFSIEELEDDEYSVVIAYSSNMSADAIVNGFFGGCTPLETILASTLDCLYDVLCLGRLLEYFPTLDQVCALQCDRLIHFSLLDGIELDKHHSLAKCRTYSSKNLFG